MLISWECEWDMVGVGDADVSPSAEFLHNLHIQVQTLGYHRIWMCYKMEPLRNWLNEVLKVGP